MKILITGSEGNIGKYLTKHLYLKHDIIATVKSKESSNIYDSLESVTTTVLDIEDFSACQNIIKNIDMVIHLAGIPSPDSTFEDVLNINMIGTRNVLESAHINGIKRIIFASSAQTIESYSIDRQIETTDPIRPKNLYGVSKCFCEALCSYYSYQKELECISIRIAAFDEVKNQNKNLGVRDLSAYLSPKDFCILIDKCIEVNMKEPYYILNAVSNNTYKRLSLENTKSLVGYDPSDNAFIECGIIQKTTDNPYT